MSDEQLRIACAEALGWTKVWHSAQAKQWYGLAPKGFRAPEVPSPLQSYDDAFALVQKAREEGWLATITVRIDSHHVAFRKRVFSLGGYIQEATDPDLCRAIVLAFLKLKGVEL